MKIYVAAKFEEKKTAREVMDLLEKMGHTITFDWTKMEDKVDEDPQRAEFYRHCSECDVRGVEEADLLLMLTHQDGKGMYFEMGVAYSNQVPIIAVGPYFRTVFFYLRGVTMVESVHEALEKLEDVLDPGRLVLTGS